MTTAIERIELPGGWKLIKGVHEPDSWYLCDPCHNDTFSATSVVVFDNDDHARAFASAMNDAAELTAAKVREIAGRRGKSILPEVVATFSGTPKIYAGPSTHICWTPDGTPKNKQVPMVLIAAADYEKLVATTAPTQRSPFAQRFLDYCNPENLEPHQLCINVEILRKEALSASLEGSVPSRCDRCPICSSDLPSLPCEECGYSGEKGPVPAAPKGGE